MEKRTLLLDDEGKMMIMINLLLFALLSVIIAILLVCCTLFSFCVKLLAFLFVAIAF